MMIPSLVRLTGRLRPTGSPTPSSEGAGHSLPGNALFMIVKSNKSIYGVSDGSFYVQLLYLNTE